MFSARNRVHIRGLVYRGSQTFLKCSHQRQVLLHQGLSLQNSKWFFLETVINARLLNRQAGSIYRYYCEHHISALRTNMVTITL